MFTLLSYKGSLNVLFVLLINPNYVLNHMAVSYLAVELL